ncbi:MAG: glycosyltransferase family 4 protein [Desulfovibrio sp.]|nr:glycosyltransferase family 4 protein [Desulfovibrio sp.]
MHVLLIALQGPETVRSPDTDNAPEHDAVFAQAARVEGEHILALACAMRDGGQYTPLLVCRRHAPVGVAAKALGLPFLSLGGVATLSGLLRLWLWQRRHERLVVQTVGVEAMDLGLRIMRQRPAGTTLLIHAFPIVPPMESALQGKALRAAHKILCGSAHVRKRIVEAWDCSHAQMGNKDGHLSLTGPKELELAPAMDVASYSSGLSWTETDAASGRHFIFCMGNALSPHSGANLAVRAMAAIRQREDLPPWEVRAYGSGPRFGEVLHEAQTLGVASRLCLLGEQPLPQALQGAHAWLAPGSSLEEAPESLWAGVAAGLPVLCSDSPLHLQRLANAPDAGGIFAADDPQSLAQAMIRLMLDTQFRNRLVAGGQNIRPYLGYDAFAECVFNMYADWCGQLGWLATAVNRTVKDESITDKKKIGTARDSGN